MAVCSSDTWLARNLTLVLMLLVTLALAAVTEAQPVALPLLLLLVAGFAFTLWLALVTPTPRLFALLLVVFFTAYADQTIGVSAGLWRYNGRDGRTMFGVLAWMVAACSAQVLSTRLVIPGLRRLHLPAPRGAASLLAFALLLVIPLTAGGDLALMGAAFWCFWGLVGTVAVLAAWRMPIHVFAGIVLSAVAIGTLGEYVGSAGSGCWSFAHHTHFPPFYLVAGCWPLAILVQVAASAFLSRQPLVDPRWQEVPAEATRAPHAPPVSSEPRHHTSHPTRQLCLFLVASAIVYLVVGLLFAIAPSQVLGAINWVSAHLTPSLPRPRLPEDRFWVALAFSMMMTIAALSLIGAAAVRRNKVYALLVLVAKLSSVLSALAYFVFFRAQLASLVIVVVDGSIFVLTAFFVFRALAAFFRQQTEFYNRHFPRPREQGEATVVVSSGGPDDKFRCLEEVLHKTGFFQLLERRARDKGKTADTFRIVIKPNFMFMHSKHDRSTFTDPELVEALVDHIARRGFTNVTLVEAQSTYGNYYANREVVKVAAHVGYRGSGNYKLVDLTQEMQPHDYGGRLGKHFVGPTWRDADFRISFAKNKTHVFSNYTLTLKNVYGTLPMQDKLGQYHTKREIDWPTIETLAHFPVDFGLIDAFVSADGQFGVIADPHPQHTHTIIGGDNLIAVDWVGATKMGLDADDPLTGRFLPLAMKTFGKPRIHCIAGEQTQDPLAPYPGWKNVSRAFIYSLDVIEEAYDFSNWWFSVLTAQDAYFTFMKKDWPTLLVRRLLAPFKRLLYPHDAM